MIVLAAPMAPCILVVMLYGIFLGWWRRYLGAVLCMLSLLLLSITTIASCDPLGPGPVAFAIGLTISVWLGWLGYKELQAGPRKPSAAPPLPTPAVATRAVWPKDVIGRWRFYIDAITSTVTIDLQSDGSYSQVVVNNLGKQIDCPGGLWTLDGPYMNLTSYRSAVRDVIAPARWFFGDWQNSLVLFAKDDPESDRAFLSVRCSAEPTLGEKCHV